MRNHSMQNASCYPSRKNLLQSGILCITLNLMCKRTMNPSFFLLICAISASSEAQEATPDLGTPSIPACPSKIGIKSLPAIRPPVQPLAIQGSQDLAIYCSPPSAALPTIKTVRDDEKDLSWLNFLSKIIPALAWPLAALAIAWRFGPELGRKLPSLRKFKAGPVEAEFNEELAALREEVDAQAADGQRPSTVSEKEARLLELAKVSPRSAIGEAWRDIEISAARAIRNKAPSIITNNPTTDNVSHNRPIKPYTLARELSQLQILNSQQLLLFHELRNLRNQAVHGEDFEGTFESANNYIQLAESLRSAIEDVGD